MLHNYVKGIVELGLVEQMFEKEEKMLKNISMTRNSPTAGGKKLKQYLKYCKLYPDFCCFLFFFRFKM